LFIDEYLEENHTADKLLTLAFKILANVPAEAFPRPPLEPRPLMAGKLLVILNYLDFTSP
jgi:hypothetical protein